jgi:hypothetical protein
MRVVQEIPHARNQCIYQCKRKKQYADQVFQNKYPINIENILFICTNNKR